VTVCDKFVAKGWGYEHWIVNKEEYCGKLLFFKKGKRCSWHYHKLKDETFHVHQGSLKVSHGESDDLLLAKSVILNNGDSFYVPVGLRHQMLALEDTWMYEFSTQHFDEDSYRITRGD
jgi:quercetin dioxygenase-like cupin family protein